MKKRHKIYVNFEKNNITLFAKQVLSTDYYEEETFSKLLDIYMENRYYNFYSDEATPFEERIFNHLRKAVMKLSEGQDDNTKARLAEMFTVFNYVLCLDGVKTITYKTLVRLVSEYHRNLYSLEDVTLFREEMTKLLKEIEEYVEQNMKEMYKIDSQQEIMNKIDEINMLKNKRRKASTPCAF